MKTKPRSWFLGCSIRAERYGWEQLWWLHKYSSPGTQEKVCAGNIVACADLEKSIIGLKCHVLTVSGRIREQIKLHFVTSDCTLPPYWSNCYWTFLGESKEFCTGSSFWTSVGACFTEERNAAFFCFSRGEVLSMCPKALCRDGLEEACAARRGCLAGREGSSGHGRGDAAGTSAGAAWQWPDECKQLPAPAHCCCLTWTADVVWGQSLNHLVLSTVWVHPRSHTTDSSRCITQLREGFAFPSETARAHVLGCAGTAGVLQGRGDTGGCVLEACLIQHGGLPEAETSKKTNRKPTGGSHSSCLQSCVRCSVSALQLQSILGQFREMRCSMASLENADIYRLYVK